MSKRINLIIESEALLDDNYMHIVNNVVRKYIAKHGQKDRYTVHLCSDQVSVYGSGQKWYDGEFYVMEMAKEGE